MTEIAVIIVAAGRGERAAVSGLMDPKQYRLVAGKPVLTRSIEAFLKKGMVVLPVIHKDHVARYTALGLSHPALLPPVIGSDTRQGSVRAGLRALRTRAPALVLIHDAARPLVSAEVIDQVVRALQVHPAALPVLAVTDTIKRSANGHSVSGTEDRKTLFAAQTPQGFVFAAIAEAHERAAGLADEFTDDAAIAEWAGLEVAMTEGDIRNLKITHPDDFARAERLLTGDGTMETRVGSGFDVHPFEDGTAVWLGGVEIPHSHKLKGHSDADVALHALTDALYGALGEGDIGHHFPPSDPQWKGARSTIFLKDAADGVARRGGRIVNLDVTIVCELPRVNPHVPAMKAVIASVCGISPDRIAIKATTSEELGFTGRREGIVAMASASIELPRT
jgi:2-C-methyl-D-erythritol 4-phosphate cytidylyltransferase/2-C-methyl-D-erythritol 2,4-cyclodiphosphate synthase